MIGGIQVRSGPGLYRAEVWLEGPRGELGPIATAALRFDNVAPGPARPIPPERLDRRAARRLWFGSGIRQGRCRSPASAATRSRSIAGRREHRAREPTRCTVAETDLGGGIEDDTISVGLLPEGLSFARVVAVSGSGMRSATVESTPLRVDATYPRGRAARRSNRLVHSPCPAHRDRLRRPLRHGACRAGGAVHGDRGRWPCPDHGRRRFRVGYRDRRRRSPCRLLRPRRGGERGRRRGRRPAAVPHDRPHRRNGAAGRLRPGPILRPNRSGSRPPSPMRFPAPTLSAGRSRSARPARASRSRGCRPRPRTEGWSPTGTRIATPPGNMNSERRGTTRRATSALAIAASVAPGWSLSNPLKEATELLSGFGGARLVWHRCSRKAGARHCRREAIEDFERRPEARTVPYGRGTAFSGRLSSSSGAPLGDLPVTVIETFAAGANPARRETVVRTRPNGTFVVRLAPGPSRQVDAAFPGNRLLSGSSGRPARFGVRSSVRLRASAATARVGGAPVAFSGRVARPRHLHPRGWDAGGAAVPARRLGVERVPHRSDRRRRPLPLPLRVHRRRQPRRPLPVPRHLPGQEGWPYEPAASRPVFVTGR